MSTPRIDFNDLLQGYNDYLGGRIFYSSVKEMLIGMYEVYRSTEKMADKLGISPTCLVNRMRKEGIQIQPKGGNDNYRRKQCIIVLK